MSSDRMGFEGRPVVLCVLDGWGWSERREGNAVAQARTPVFDRMWANEPRCMLRTDGPEVGLPEGQFGNSEVGHMNLGAGRIVMQELPRIDRALDDGSLAGSKTFQGFRERARDGSGRVHLMGLMSPGGVHSHQRHMIGIAHLLDEAGLETVLHLFTDGRDTSPRGGAVYLAEVEEAIAGLRAARIGTIGGRYFAMDRDKRWERTRKAFAAMVEGRGASITSAAEAIDAAYGAETGDEFIEPAVVGGYEGMRDGDALLCINFRADRVRQLLGAMLLPEFDGFERPRRPTFSAAVGMTSYSRELDEHLLVLFPPADLASIMGEVVADAGLRQLRMAETEKYPHVTFFFNGGEEQQYPGEERIMIRSPKVATYDLQPSMSAPALTDAFVDAVERNAFDVILINFANPDMVGHTGSLRAAIDAVETVDACMERVLGAVREAGGAVLVTADHGNCETMIDPQTGDAHTAHTLNPVPCYLAGGPDGVRLEDGRLADVAPTLLALLGIEQPAAMDGRCLLRSAVP